MKKKLLLIAAIATYNSSYAEFHSFPAAHIYPSIIDLGNKYEIQRITSDRCFRVASTQDVFEFSWDKSTILDNINYLTTQLVSFAQYKKILPVAQESKPKKGKIQFPQINFDEVEDFHLLSEAGKIVFCNTLKQKELEFDKKINHQRKLIPSELLNYVSEYYPLPSSYQEGFIQTKNHTGDEVSITTPYINDFLQRVAGKKVFDIGSGFGINTQRALSHNASQVFAIDFSIEQLQAVVARAPADKINNLFIVNRKIPELFKENLNETADIVLLSHVLHYLTPDQAEETLAGIYNLLKKGGMLYIQALTISAAPYTSSFDQNSVSLFSSLQEKEREYDKSVAKNTQHNFWPTYLGNIMSHTNFPMIHPQYLPALIEACKRNGFEIMQSGTYNLVSGQSSDQGDALGVIAIKK
ncbi:class I SAM-dependent methyltransferase [Pigmentibacter sp. JX0631]|uniref:class I SAM-dependent methyltransferase n=1 Tax=Pigmentibacter sp. JX0631 TaxID=2976982 RepID=UPI002469AF12|nr:class I SAM-dependent methyltransferase [Pigmentibacter sp. JX0631]WGL60044.1 class I SAM-dependent methyltransferase [Pigmentibacter sp. JX0631]